MVGSSPRAGAGGRSHRCGPQRRRRLLAVCVAALAARGARADWPMGGISHTQRLRCDEPDAAESEACTTNVVVVGAGLAGLSTARALQDLWASTLPNRPDPPREEECSEEGDECEPVYRVRPRGELNLTVLEARDRIGGRVHTKRLEGAAPEDGDEMGAMWVHGSDDAANPIAQVAGLLGLTLKTVSAGGAPAEFRACGAAGSAAAPCDAVSASDFDDTRECFHLLIEEAQKTLPGSSSAAAAENGGEGWDSDTEDGSLQDTIDRVVAKRSGFGTGTPLTVGAFDCSVESAGQEMQHYLAADIELYYGASSAELDAKWYNYAEFDGTTFPPLLDRLDAGTHQQGNAGAGPSDSVLPGHDGAAHEYGGVGARALITEGYDKIVESLQSGNITFQLDDNNMTDPSWTFSSTQGGCDLRSHRPSLRRPRLTARVGLQRAGQRGAELAGAAHHTRLRQVERPTGRRLRTERHARDQGRRLRGGGGHGGDGGAARRAAVRLHRVQGRHGLCGERPRLHGPGWLRPARRPPAVFQAERDRQHRLRQHQQAVPPLRRRRLHTHLLRQLGPR